MRQFSGKKKTLIVNDDPFLSILIKNILSQEKILVTLVNNGTEAVEICKKEYFDAIIMNIQMPIMDGFTATTEIRGFNKRIIIIAESSFHYDPERFLSAGFTDYIFTPFTEKDLLQLVTKYLL